MATPPVDTLIVLGAGGDLTSRLLLPGLGSLLSSSRGTDLKLIGVDRAEVSDDAWRAKVEDAFDGTPSARASRVARASTYLVGDATSADDLGRALAAATGRTALYFALPPAVAEKACAALREVDRPPGLVLALEKPFGSDYGSARRLNRLLETLVPEEQVFRVDHFLGKSTVLNLIGLRFANRLLEPLLSAQNVERVDIVADEALGLEGRAGYYDHAGALRDMIQSHLLLVLALAAMEPPSSVESEDLRGAMAQVLRATRPWRPDGTTSRRGRYTAGTIGGRALPDYADEPGVVAAHRTETLAEMTVAIDTWRWAGVPFTLRSGKALGTGRQEIVFTLRDVPHLPSGMSGPKRTARIRIGLKPAVLELDLATNGRGDPFDLEWETLRTDFADNELSAYGEVLAELVEGDPTLSVRGDVAEQCWRIVGPVLAAWERGEVPLQSYAAGSDGPRGWGTPLV
ncbi:glucose-6-phosphate dehydrogenase [Schumannella sp. 10F1B-5-1]|uniref:glucose-6-phosphate dehydrogenase n=1 Tax=Schumannella sp. 10F1B-5-1 TaxID=2590780 RepID=UPI001130514B|nr:glucose-6-phosphate dehydrogenase [Schumannella sp. 10F1B-5-1]TPW70060.1 glucose-6-phosphate dehydrogenase [Schumannella sp. 10F1B-5-1]